MFLGDALVDWLAESGQTVDMRTLWTSRVSSVIRLLCSVFDVVHDDYRS